MAVADTSPEARAIQLQIHRSMSGEQRILIALEMSEFVRGSAKAGIRDAHPDWEEWRIDLEWYKMIFSPHRIPLGLENALRLAASSAPHPRAI